MRKNKSQKGITIVSLIITIIILLILAVVAIGPVQNDGILIHTEEAREKTEVEEIKESIQIDILEAQAQNYGDISEDKLNSILSKYGEVIEEGENKIISTDNGYSIKVSDIYNGTLIVEGKSVAELYDGVNEPNDEKYNEDAMHIGDYVNYTAGNWEEDNQAPLPKDQFAFGGYTSGQSRDTNGEGSFKKTSSGVTYGEGKYEGWRIWDISNDKKTITLISAGCPEVYYFPSGTNHGYISEFIMSGTINSNAQDTSIGDMYTTRDWSMYENESQYAILTNNTTQNARAMRKSDLDMWYGKYIDNTINDSYNITRFPANTENKLISTVENGFYYWLACAGNSDALNYVTPKYYNVGSGGSGDTRGVRVLVTLSSKVKFEEVPEKVEQDGFSYNKWIIKRIL